MPSGPTIALVVCGSLVLIALLFGGWMRWIRSAPPATSPQFKPMNISTDSDEATASVPLGTSTPQQVGRVGANHPVPMYSPSPGAVIPSGPGIVGAGGHLIAPASAP
ncbi:MAG: hypothetical protein ACYCW6_11160 [Candidatus Xenobia bacterium]